MVEREPGSTSPLVKETLKKVESKLSKVKPDERLQKILKVLKKKDKEEIIQAVLEKFYNAEELKPYQAELIKMQRHLERTGKKMVILFDGRDASGKGGTIRRVTRYMNEKRYHVVALGKPNEVQKTELHIKRYIEHFPHAGEVVLFDRSWYNRALVEPVMGFCTQKQYKRFLNKVNSYEQNFLDDDGRTFLLKLYFSVSKEEQARRFELRHPRSRHGVARGMGAARGDGRRRAAARSVQGRRRGDPGRDVGPDSHDDDHRPNGAGARQGQPHQADRDHGSEARGRFSRHPDGGRVRAAALRAHQ